MLSMSVFEMARAFLSLICTLLTQLLSNMNYSDLVLCLCIVVATKWRLHLVPVDGIIGSSEFILQNLNNKELR